MCNPASFVLTKDQVFWSLTTDSHSDILFENNILEETNSDIVHVLRVEITPPDHDYSRPVSEWTFKTDQDVLPTWYDPIDDEARARKALPAWIKAKVVVDQFKSVDTGTIYATGVDTDIRAAKKCGVYLRHGANAKAYDNVVVKAYDRSKAVLRDQSEASLYNNARAELNDSARAALYDGSEAVALMNSTVELYDLAKVEAYGRTNVRAFSNSTVLACDYAMVSAYDNAKITASESARVFASGNSVVNAQDHAIVTAKSSATLHLSGYSVGIITGGNVTFTLSEHAVCIDQRGPATIVHTVQPQVAI